MNNSMFINEFFLNKLGAFHRSQDGSESKVNRKRTVVAANGKTYMVVRSFTGRISERTVSEDLFVDVYEVK